MKDKIKNYKMVGILIVILIFLFSCVQKEHILFEKSLSPELSVKEISRDVFLITHSFPWPANSLMVRMNNNEFLWIDTPYTPEATEKILNLFYDKFGSDIRFTEINTGFHIDNLGGNEELINRNIPVYGSDLTCDLIKTKSKSTLTKIKFWLISPENKKYLPAYEKIKFMQPDRIFPIKETQILKFGEEKVEIFYPGPTHTYDNLVVYISSKRVLFGGCMILEMKSDKPGFSEDGNVSEWPVSLQKVKERYAETQIIVPGHGLPGNSDLIDHTIYVLTKM